MKPYGHKIKGGCMCEYCYNSKNKGKNPKKRERQKSKENIKKELKDE
jgi:biotin synthase-like enzyme